ncbi:MAG: NAD(P)-dependent alcohol dehydrogenase [Bacteroidetes bacterium]|nr:NAD(P)-dependent alcohol dehydrogenase [Bacteroidota bacterium]
MQIHAYAAHQAKDKLAPWDYQKPDLKPNDVEVKISHCGICHSDIHLIDDDWKMSRFPLVPGHEVVGTVTQTGSAVSLLKSGDRVGIGWQSGSCGTCEWCVSGQDNMCSKAQPTCVGRHGGFADSIITSERFAFKLPDNLESESAAPLLCAGVTVFSPYRLYQVKEGMKVAVLGIGGLGHLAVQFANKLGFETTAISGSPDKATEAKELGAHHFLLNSDPAELKSKANSFDFILTTVSASLDWMPYMNMLRPNGKLCFVGATGGNITVPTGLLLGRQKSICGSNIGGVKVMNEMLEFAAKHQVVAKTEVMPMNQVNDAIEKVRHNQARYRMVLETGGK